jgi:hypothetical protein
MIEGELQLEKLVLTVGAERRVHDWKIRVQPNATAIKAI